WNRNNFMNGDDSPAQGTRSPGMIRMEPIARADVAAFRNGSSAMANAMIEESGIRIQDERRRGRAAGINPSGRFEPVTRHVFDDGWNTIEELPPFKTEVQTEKPRTIITRNQ